MYKFLLQRDDLNEATSFYLDIIKRALLNIGENVEYVSSLKDITPLDKVLTIRAKTFFLVWLQNPKQYIANWYQGIVPEEIMCLFENSFSKYFRKYIWTVWERFALNHARKNIFVSKSMLEFYQKKYGYTKCNNFIMPCFNQVLDVSSFTEDKYKSPTFVYAGSLSRWQCIDETLSLFAKIKEILPQASITLLTKEQIRAQKLCEKHNVSAQIKFVPSTELNKELAKYKYGFLVRDDIAVNNVSTPTKMNSYMAAGVIPVYSNVIGDFQPIFKDLNNVISFKSTMECINKIMLMEKTKIHIDELRNEYKTIFDNYYSIDRYINQLQMFFNIDI